MDDKTTKYVIRFFIWVLIRQKTDNIRQQDSLIYQKCHCSVDEKLFLKFRLKLTKFMSNYLVISLVICNCSFTKAAIGNIVFADILYLHCIKFTAMLLCYSIPNHRKETYNSWGLIYKMDLKIKKRRIIIQLNWNINYAFFSIFSKCLF